MACSPLSCSDDALQDIFNGPRGVFTTCECKTSCSETSHCSCRDLAEIYDLRDNPNIYAYSEVISSRVSFVMIEIGMQGLFTFEVPRGVEVIECNKVRHKEFVFLFAHYCNDY